jgi:predicted membrane-bound dolichyl-phosphate-mannose-protein mannosyltransferase
MTRHLRSPVVLLAVLSVLSFGLRIAFLNDPCMRPCTKSAQHTLIFDEVYYVNAARVIAGIEPPAGQHYTGTPLGDDPNAEHPQGVKLLMAALIDVFGDGPFAWRIGSVIMGSLALLGMYLLARGCGAGRWPALGAAALLASDNLLLVAGRIGTLDIYAVTAMICAAALYVRRRPVLAGVVLGVGAACKEVTPYALLVFALLEAGYWWRARSAPQRFSLGGACARVAACAVVTIGVFIGLLAIMDAIAAPYNYSTGFPVGSGPFHHLSHILSFATNETSPNGPSGIASYPWGWLFDYKPIVYLNINPAEPSPGLMDIYPAVHFLGIISPPMLLLALPALGFAAAALLRPSWSWAGLRPVVDEGVSTDLALGDVSLVGLAWVLGTYIPYIVLSVVWHRTSYLYYMVIVMPGLYLILAALATRARDHRRLLWGWIVTIAIALVIMYPLTPLP